MLPDKLGIAVFFTLRRNARGQFGNLGLKRRALCLQLLPVLGNLRAERGAPGLKLLLMAKRGLIKSLIECALQALLDKPGIAGSLALLLFKLRMQQPHLGFTKGNQGLHMAQLAGHTVLACPRFVCDQTCRCVERDREVEHLQRGGLAALKRGDADGQDMVAGRLGRDLVCHIIQFIRRQRPGPVAVSLPADKVARCGSFSSRRNRRPRPLKGVSSGRSDRDVACLPACARAGRRAGEIAVVQCFCRKLRARHAMGQKGLLRLILLVYR